MQTFNRVQDAFPARPRRMHVVVKAKDVTAPAVHGRASRSSAATAQAPQALFPGDARPTSRSAPTRRSRRSTSRSPATASDARVGPGAGRAARRRSCPRRSARSAACEAYVDGQTAQDRDFNDTLNSHLPLVFGFVIIAAFLLLLVTFRSIVIPIKAIVLNLLSVARGLRRAGAGLPARLVQGPARLLGDRADRRRGCRCSCS